MTTTSFEDLIREAFSDPSVRSLTVVRAGETFQASMHLGGASFRCITCSDPADAVFNATQPDAKLRRKNRNAVRDDSDIL